MELSYFGMDKYNCAETTAQYLHERGKLTMPLELIPAMSCFGGGMSCGLTCGAVTAAVAALGLATGKRLPTDPREPSKAAVQAFVARFTEQFGGLTCKELLVGIEPDSPAKRTRCLAVVEAAATIAEEVYAQQAAQQA